VLCFREREVTSESASESASEAAGSDWASGCWKRIFFEKRVNMRESACNKSDSEPSVRESASSESGCWERRTLFEKRVRVRRRVVLAQECM
jgi:hypothetical protein